MRQKRREMISTEEKMDSLSVHDAVFVGYLLVPRFLHVRIEYDEPAFVDAEMVRVAANLLKRLLGALVPKIAKLYLDGVLAAPEENAEIEGPFPRAISRMISLRKASIAVVLPHCRYAWITKYCSLRMSDTTSGRRSVAESM